MAGRIPAGDVRSYAVEGLAAGELIVAANVCQPLIRHRHRRFCLGLMEQGRWLLQQGGAEVLVESGQIYLISPGVIHSLRPAGHELCRYQVLCFGWTDNLAAGTQQQPDTLYPAIGVADDDRLAAELAGLLAAIRRGTGVSEGWAERFADFLRRLRRYFQRPTPEPLPGWRQPAVQKVRNYLDHHFAEAVGMEELTALTGLSPYYLNRICTDGLGMPPREYRNWRRVEEARRMLENGLGPLAAGLAVGFADQSHFSRAFKKRMGMTPGQYCQRNR